MSLGITRGLPNVAQTTLTAEWPLATRAAEEHTPHRDKAHFKGFPTYGDG